ncbi:unnamed protein product [Paramecium sonneborni]|uniref:Uncharacterized protein n=1 Tax=Paramecium sonneborni TaxID=65129 RepID=A0A8S1RAI5_9CILI|nr:unnamed protein product [Paramecium sonneborni]
MKSILFVLVMLMIVVGERLSINDPKCYKYFQKFGTANNPDGTGASLAAFTGDVQFVNQADVKVTLRYSDEKLFNDPMYFGLVQEDGNPEENTCLDLKLWKFSSNQYSNPIQITDLPITSSNNSQRKWRFYHFTIPQTDIKKRLQETSNSDQFIYKGYFAIGYYAAIVDQLQYTFYFEFSVTIEKETGVGIDTAFKPFTSFSTFQCMIDQPCIATADTSLKWCSDSSCSIPLTTAPDLHLNDQFVLQQVITRSGMTGYYLVETEVWYTGNGLYKKAKPINMNNATKGQVIIQLRAEIVWQAVTIRVTSVLSTFYAGGRRLLIQTQYDPVTGETNQIECIKAEGKNTCATCEEECQINNFAKEGCPKCSSIQTQNSSNSSTQTENQSNQINQTENPSSQTENQSTSENPATQNENQTTQTQNSSTQTQGQPTQTQNSTIHTQNSSNQTENQPTQTQDSTIYTQNSSNQTENQSNQTQNQQNQTENSSFSLWVAFDFLALTFLCVV